MSNMPPPSAPPSRMHEDPPPARIDPILDKYKRMKRRYYDMDQRCRDLQADLQRAAEQNRRLASEKEILEMQSTTPTSTHTHTPAGPQPHIHPGDARPTGANPYTSADKWGLPRTLSGALMRRERPQIITPPWELRPPPHARPPESALTHSAHSSTSSSTHPPVPALPSARDAALRRVLDDDTDDEGQPVPAPARWGSVGAGRGHSQHKCIFGEVVHRSGTGEGR
ncbi:hypothetical protein JB92DRAFT_1850549 [Gautieria morchelliformis]|nr:hypothetical protein JB92DRAFT_1850549 [Gautieria morchelliformis]